MLPTRNGVSPSCVALPSGPWPLVIDFLVQRIPAVSRDDWAERMAAGGVVQADGTPDSAIQNGGVPPFAGALLKNEQDMSLLERILNATRARRN